MGIGPLELSGGMTRVQDFANMRSAEEARPVADQAAFSDKLHKEIREKSETVKRGDDVDYEEKKFDAKEKGSNEYEGDGGKKRRNDGVTTADGSVKVKSVQSIFDVRI